MGEHWKDKKFGEVSWNERPRDHMRLSSDSVNRLRILDEPELFHVHWVKQPDFDRQERFRLVKCDEPAPCNLCESGIKQTIRCRTNVLDRRDGQVKQVEFGAMIYNQIKQYAMDLGDPTTYDISIRRIPRRNANTSTYEVAAGPPSELDIDSQAAVNLFRQEEVPVGRLVLDIDICPHCNIIGMLRGKECQCPRCKFVIWTD